MVRSAKGAAVNLNAGEEGNTMTKVSTWFPLKQALPRKLAQQQVRAKRMFLGLRLIVGQNKRGPFKDAHGHGRFLRRDRPDAV